MRHTRKVYAWPLLALLASHPPLLGSAAASTSLATPELALTPLTAVALTPEKAALAPIESQAQKKSLPLRFRVGLSHSIGAKSDSDPLSTLDLTASYKASDALAFAIDQRLSKLYIVEAGEDEVQVADTKLSTGYTFYAAQQGPLGLGVKLGFDATLPSSRFSREQDLRTVLGTQLSLTRDLGPFKFMLRPFYRFHVNQYKTLANDESAQTLLRYRLGLRFDASIAVTPKLSLDSSTQWIERHYEDPPYGSHPADHDYAFDFGFGYEMDKRTNLALGYSQSNRAEQLGTVDVYLFDTETSEYYVSATRDL